MIFFDHRGSVKMVVNTDTDAVVQEIEYTAYGEVISDSNPGFQPFYYAGGMYDQDTTLIRFGARDYDPETGSWIQRDPIRFDGGMNLYGYVGGDPVNMIDVTGLKSESVSLYAGLGITITWGTDPNGEEFLTMTFGAGLGISYFYSEDGTSPGYEDSDGDRSPLYDHTKGFCANAGYSAVIASGGISYYSGTKELSGKTTSFTETTPYLEPGVASGGFGAYVSAGFFFSSTKGSIIKSSNK